MNKRLILIVDDEPLNVDTLEQELQYLGYDTDTASNGEEALARVSAQRPDLILLDVMMPVMDGFTACRTLKAAPQTRAIPIVFMTALHEVNDRITGKDAGARDFLTKPVHEDELRSVIKNTFEELTRQEEERDRIWPFVPYSIRERLHAHDIGKREEDATVLFVDICEYTLLSERLSPTALNRIGERLFSAFMAPIYGHGGEITETSGDGMMIVFHGGAPDENAVRGVETALELNRMTDEVNEDGGGAPLAIHMGANSGIASVGTTVYEGPHGCRYVYTADGLVTNVAARLASMAGPREILVGAETAARLGSAATVRSIGQQSLKNISAPIEVFSVTEPEDR